MPRTLMGRSVSFTVAYVFAGSEVSEETADVMSLPFAALLVMTLNAMKPPAASTAAAAMPIAATFMTVPAAVDFAAVAAVGHDKIGITLHDRPVELGSFSGLIPAKTERDQIIPFDPYAVVAVLP